MKFNAIAWNFIAHHGKFKWLLSAFTENSNVDRRSLGPLEQVRHIAGVHVVGGLAIDRNDYVARVNARAVCRCANERGNDDDLVIARAYSHSNPVVFAALIFPE